MPSVYAELLSVGDSVDRITLNTIQSSLDADYARNETTLTIALDCRHPGCQSMARLERVTEESPWTVMAAQWTHLPAHGLVKQESDQASSPGKRQITTRTCSPNKRPKYEESDDDAPPRPVPRSTVPILALPRSQLGQQSAPLATTLALGATFASAQAVLDAFGSYADQWSLARSLLGPSMSTKMWCFAIRCKNAKGKMAERRCEGYFRITAKEYDSLWCVAISQVGLSSDRTVRTSRPDHSPTCSFYTGPVTAAAPRATPAPIVLDYDSLDEASEGERDTAIVERDLKPAVPPPAMPAWTRNGQCSPRTPIDPEPSSSGAELDTSFGSLPDGPATSAGSPPTSPQQTHASTSDMASFLTRLDARLARLAPILIKAGLEDTSDALHGLKSDSLLVPFLMALEEKDKITLLQRVALVERLNAL